MPKRTDQALLTLSREPQASIERARHPPYRALASVIAWRAAKLPPGAAP